MIRNIDTFRHVFNVEGYAAPPEVDALFAMYDAVNAAAYRGSAIDYASLAEEADPAAKLYERMLQFMVTRELRLEAEQGLQSHVRNGLTRLVRQEADKILDALRPKFDSGADAVRRCRAFGISAGTSAEWILGLGDDAIAAWRHLPEARRKLDSVLAHVGLLGSAGVYGEYSSTHDMRQIKASRVLRHIGHDAIAVFGALPPTGPAGIWLTLAEAGLQLNTVAQTRELLDSVPGYHTSSGYSDDDEDVQTIIPDPRAVKPSFDPRDYQSKAPFREPNVTEKQVMDLRADADRAGQAWTQADLTAALEAERRRDARASKDTVPAAEPKDTVPQRHRRAATADR